MPVKTQKNGQARAKAHADPRDDESSSEQPQEETQAEDQQQEPAEDQERETQPAAREPESRPAERAAKKSNAGQQNRQKLLLGLNQDLSGEYQAILMYTHYSAKLTGPFRKELRALFQAEIADEQGHAQFLADKIAALGGEPTTQPRPVLTADDPREMLEHALDAEKQAIADYRQRIEQAEEFGDVGLKVDLENQIADETRHKEEMERILAGWDRA